MDKQSEKRSLDFSFACGGWLKMYLFGVAKFLQKNDCINLETSRFTGSSAGALTATGLALECDFDKIKDYIVNDVVPRAHGQWCGAFRVRTYLNETIEKFGNTHKFEELNDTDKLQICYTSLSKFQARKIINFVDADHLKTTLLASCCASPIAGLPFKHGDEWIFDGGLTSFQPVFDDDTVTISPFYCTNADIRPSRYVPMWWALYPPCQENIEWLYKLGYEDGQKWAFRKGLINEVPNQDKLYASKSDGAWQSRFGRFIGYSYVENHVLDAIFVALVVLLWRPLAFLLMYIELSTRAVISASKAACFAVACRFMIAFAVCSLLASAFPLFLSNRTMIISDLIFILLIVFLASLLFGAGGVKEASDIAISDWKVCITCLRNMASLSLILRVIPIIGSTVPIKRHRLLLEHSFIYRLTSHFV